MNECPAGLFEASPAERPCRKRQPLDRPNRLPWRERKGKVLHDGRDHEGRLLQGKGRADAHARPHAEGQIGSACQCRGELRHHLSPHQWSKRASLAEPLLALDGDKPVAQPRGQDPPLERALAVVRRIFNQHLADGRRIAHQDNTSERKAAHHDPLFEMGFRPALDRIVSEGLQQGQATQRPRLRRRPGRPKSETNRGHGLIHRN